MTEVVYYVAASVDGFIATSDGGVEWLDRYQIQGEDYGYEAFIKSVDVIIMGRSTYEQVLGFGAWPYTSQPTIVLTHHAEKPAPPGVELLALTPGECVDLLSERGFRRAWLVGGGATAGGFSTEGLISELILSVMPVMLGEGISLFAKHARVTPLVLTEYTTFANGVLQVRYTRARA